MCLAPCFAGCTKQEYDREMGDVLATLESSGAWLMESLEQERERASEALDFERAALLHKRLDKASDALRGLPEIARRVENLNAVILQKAAEEKVIAAFPVLGGLVAAPLFLNFGDVTAEPRSAEAVLKRALEPELFEKEEGTENAGRLGEVGKTGVTENPQTSAESRARFGMKHAAVDLPEHLSLVSRWFYSKPRDGEILFKEKVWPYRRIMRACNRLLAPSPEIRPIEPPAN